MTTALAAQLQQLASLTGATAKRPRGKPSLLYTYQEAADIGNDAIYAVGLQGFEQLCQLDARFQPFGSTLFSQANLSYVREQQTAEQNAKLDASVLAFCRLLSGYFLLQPAFKALEYLVRRFKVNEHNVDALMHTALPYHATNEFVRLVQVLRLEGNGVARLWEFLAPMQQSGAAMPREVLVQRCVNDKALLRFVCEMAQSLSSPQQAGRVAMSFYAVVLCEAVAAMKMVGEAQVSMLLPYLVAGLGGDVIPDYRAATHMVITQLASRVAMSSELVTALVKDLCRGQAAAAALPQVLLVLAHLAATQPHLMAFPNKALQHLAKAGGVAAELAALSEKGVRLAPLLSLLLKAAAAQAPSHAGCARLLEEVASSVPLGAAAAPLATALLEQAAGEGLSESGRDALLRTLRTLELRYPAELDAAVNAALAPPAGGDESGSGAARRERLFGLLEAAFGGTARAPVAEAGATLAVALDAPSAAVREMALQKLANLSLSDDGSGEGAGAELAAFVQSAVLRRVQDDSPAVALAALAVAALGDAPAGPRFDALATAYHKAIRQVLDPGTKKAARKDAREVAKECLKQLSGPFLAANPSYSDQVALLALDGLPATPLTRKLPAAALKCAAKLENPLLQGLQSVKFVAGEEAPPPEPKKGSKKKGSKGAEEGSKAGAEGGSDAAFNRSVLAELAKHVAADAEAQAALQRLLALQQRQGEQGAGDAASGRRGTLLLLSVANAGLKLEGGAHMAGGLLAQLLAHPASAAAGSGAQPEFTQEGLLSDSSLTKLAEGALSQRALSAQLALTALEAVPKEWLAQQGEQGLAKLFTGLCQQLPGSSDAHLEAFVRRAGEAVPVSQLLSGIFGLPVEAGVPAGVQAAALRMLAHALRAGLSAAGGKAAAKGRGKAAAAGEAAAGAGPEDRPLAVLLRLLSALANPERAVRAAGVGAVAALAESCPNWWSEAAAAEGAVPSREQVEAVLAAVAAQRAAIEADAEALEQLLVRALGGASASASAGGAGGRRGRGAQKKGSDAEHEGRLLSLELSPADADALGQLLLAQLPAQRGAAGLPGASLALHVLSSANWGMPGQLLLAGWRLLGTLGGGAQQAQQEGQLAADLLTLYTPAAVAELQQGSHAALAPEVLATLLRALGPGQQGLGRQEGARLAALSALSVGLYEILPESTRRDVVVALLRSNSQDPSEQCRAAARAALAALPLAPSTLRPLLEITAGGAAAPSSPPVAKRRRPRPGSASGHGAAAESAEHAAPHVDAAKLELCVSVLELLQWKDNLESPLELVPAVQAALSALLSWHSEADAAAAGGAAAAPAAPQAPLPGGTYALQLALSALLRLVQRAQQQGAGTDAFDLSLAVRCAQAAPDAGLRNSALTLVGALAQAAPKAALSHVLEVVGVVGRSAAMQADTHSNKVASQVLAAVVPAWVAGGGSVGEVVAAVVAAAPKIPSHRRLAVFTALVDSLPQVEGLCATLAALLEQALVPAQQESGRAEADADAAWSTELAGALLARAPLQQQAATLAALLRHSMQAAEQQPTEPLPLLATAFATQQLQMQAGKARGAAAAAAVAEGHEALMQAALVALQRAGEMGAAEARKLEKKGGKKSAKTLERIRAATTTTYKLLQALQRVMDAEAYISSLAVLIGSPMDKVRRRALGLVVAAVKQAAAEQEEEGGGKVAAGLEAAAVAAVPPTVRLLQPGELPAGHEPVAALTQQAALAALGALAAAFGATSPQPFLAAMPAVLAAAADARWAVRSSALATIAAIAKALGPRMVPVLPAVVKGVLGAAQAAAAAVAASQEAGGASDGEQEGADEEQAGEGSSDEEEQGGEGQQGAAGRKRKASSSSGGSGVGEAAALELAASLAATSALVETLGAFLAPHLPALLGLLLAPAVLGCSAARCADAAAAVRARLAEGVAPHLLVAPLVGQLEPAVEAGSVAVCALLRMLSTAVGAMDSAATASHHEAVFGCLLRALDLRRRRPASLAPAGAPAAELAAAVEETEAAAVAAFVALTLKLSEAQFKPLFLRLLDWTANAPAAGAAGAAPAGAAAAAAARAARGAALAALCNALSERLRSVFVPYFRYLLDPFLAHLTDGSAATPAKKKKKKAKTGESGEAGAQGGVDASDPLAVEDDWRLRLQIVRALHRCFLYDTGSGSSKFVDEPRFQRLLPPLVAHLALRPPAAAAAALEAAGGEGDALEAGLELGQAAAELDVVGKAVVGCLAQLAVAAGSDALWKTLNHQVLMASRSLDPRARLLSLETAAQLAGRLREEYLVLLPETLPFLAELLEDAEASVEARAAEVVRQLEELSGESLAEYLK